MKKFSWLFFLCTFIVLIAPPGWATTFEVTNTDTAITIKSGDTALGGVSTLAELSTKLENGDTINFTGTINLGDNDSLDIRKKVTITGEGAVIDAKTSNNRAYPVIRIKNTDGTAANGTSITGLTIQNVSRSVATKRDGGGAIQIVSVDDVSISDVKILSCSIGYGVKAYQYSGGAGIYVQDSNVTINNSYFQKNQMSYFWSGGATEDGGGGVYVLAFARDASVDVISCDFSSNDRHVNNTGQSQVGTHAGTTVNGSGGAMANVVGNAGKKVYVKVIDSTFVGNMAGRYAGALYNLTDDKGSVDVTIQNTSFINNKLDGVKNNGATGGAIHNYAYSGQINLRVYNSLFDGNSAKNGIINSNQFGATGGAIVLDTNATGSASADIVGCRFENNSAYLGGALVNWGSSNHCIMNVTDCTFVGNKTIEHKWSGDSAPLIYLGSAFISKATTDAKYSSDINGRVSDDHGITTWSVDVSNGQHGHAASTLTNCTFYNNEGVAGGTVAAYKPTSNQHASVSVINCTFVNNKITSESKKANGIDLLTSGTNGSVLAFNSIFYNVSAGAEGVNMFSRTSDASLISLDNCAIPTATTVSGEIHSGDNLVTIENVKFASASNDTPTKVEVNGVTHTIFKISATDDEKLRRGLNKSVYSITNVVTNQTSTIYAPKADILGVTRASTPSMGAVEYVSFDITDTTEPLKAKVGVTLTHKISKDFDTNATYDWNISEDVSEFTYLTSLSVDKDGVITVTPTAKPDAAVTFTVKAVGTGAYEAYTATKEFTLSVDATTLTIEVSADTLAIDAYTGVATTKQLAATVSGDYSGTDELLTGDGLALKWEITEETDGMTLTEDGAFTVNTSTVDTYTVPIKVTATYTSGDVAVSNDKTATVTITVTAAPVPKLTVSPSTDITAARGAELSLTITAVSGEDFHLVWLSDGDLPDGIISADSEENPAVVTISGTVDEAATLGLYTFTVTASNDYGTADLPIKITVEDVAPVISPDSYSFNARKGVASTQEVTATAGTDIKWTLDGAPEWVTIEGSGKTAVITAIAPVSEKAGTAYSFSAVASNDKARATAKVTATVTGSIAGSDEDYTEGEVFASDATPVASTNAAGQPVATTTSVFRDGAGNIMLSMDIAITLEDTEIPAIVDRSFDSQISVDVTYELAAENYDAYVYFFGVTGLPASLDVSGDALTSTDEIVRGEPVTKHYNFKMTGVPQISADNAITVSFDVYVAGDAPTLLASDYIDATLKVRTSYTETKGSDGNTYTNEEVVDEETGEVKLVIGSDSGNGSLANALNSIIDNMKSGGSTDAEVAEYFSTVTVTPNEKITDISSLVSVGVVKSLDLTEASNVQNTELILTNTSVTQVVMNENTSKVLTTLTLANSSVKVVKANNSNLTTLTLGGSDSIETVEVNNTPITALDASGCENLETIQATECQSMTSLNAEGCKNLTTVTANRCDNVETMNFKNCVSLKTVSAQGNFNEDGEKPTGIKDVELEGCGELEEADFSHNRILRKTLDGNLFPNLKRADFGGQREAISRMSNIINFLTLFARTLSVNVVNVAEESEATVDEEIILSEEDADSLGRVNNVKGIDEFGNEIEGTYDATTGNATFDKAPKGFKYEYDMGARAGAETDFDATVIPAESINPAELPGPGESSGSGGGGCDAGFGLCAAAMALATLLMKKR